MQSAPPTEDPVFYAAVRGAASSMGGPDCDYAGLWAGASQALDIPNNADMGNVGL